MKIHMASRIRYLALPMAVCVIGSASAQMYTPWVSQPPIYFGTAAQLNMINSVRRAQQIAQNGNSGTPSRSSSQRAPAPRAVDRGEGGSPATTSAAASNLAVDDNQTITAQVRATFLRGLSERNGQAAADEVDKRLGNIRTTFSRVVTPYGLRANDFADVTTAYMVIMWMASNRQIDLPTVNQVQGVRQQMRALMDGRSDDVQQRQLLAETMMYQTCMAVMVREQAAARRTPELLDAMAAELDKGSSQSASLRQLALTDNGLARR